jgi:hypothetical protein
VVDRATTWQAPLRHHMQHATAQQKDTAAATGVHPTTAPLSNRVEGVVWQEVAVAANKSWHHLWPASPQQHQHQRQSQQSSTLHYHLWPASHTSTSTSANRSKAQHFTTICGQHHTQAPAPAPAPISAKLNTSLRSQKKMRHKTIQRACHAMSRPGYTP